MAPRQGQIRWLDGQERNIGEKDEGPAGDAGTVALYYQNRAWHWG